ncbi:MAG: response regulator [Luteimonas sp.]
MPRAPGQPYRVLLIEDSRDDAELIEIALREDGPAVECRRAWSADTVRDALQALAPQVVLSDLNLPGFSGLEALEQVRAHDPGLPFVLLTGSAPMALPDPPPGADAVLSKDDLHKLPALVRRLLP